MSRTSPKKLRHAPIADRRTRGSSVHACPRTGEERGGGAKAKFYRTGLGGVPVLGRLQNARDPGWTRWAFFGARDQSKQAGAGKRPSNF